MIATKKTMTVLLVLVFEMTKGNSNKNIFIIDAPRRLFLVHCKIRSKIR